MVDSVQAKLLRSEEHLQELDAALSGECPRTRRVMVVSRRLPPKQHVIDVDERQPQDATRVPILVGEVLQGLRSALDHLIGELERGNGVDRDSGFEFPIFWDRARYKREAERKIRGVPAEALEVIERIQPYHRPAPSYKDHPLWILHDLNNADKHRVLIGTKDSITVDNFDIALAPGEKREHVLAISPLYRLVPSHEPETAEGERWTLSATFTQFGQRDRQPIIPGLVELRDVVTQIVEECRRAARL